MSPILSAQGPIHHSTPPEPRHSSTSHVQRGSHRTCLENRHERRIPRTHRRRFTSHNSNQHETLKFSRKQHNQQFGRESHNTPTFPTPIPITKPNLHVKQHRLLREARTVATTNHRPESPSASRNDPRQPPTLGVGLRVQCRQRISRDRMQRSLRPTVGAGHEQHHPPIQRAPSRCRVCCVERLQ